MQLDEHKQMVFQSTLAAMQQFQETFGMKPSPDAIAELHVAMHLGLTLPDQVDHPGFDALAEDGTRYQIKERALSTNMVDMNNFDFDFIVLVNLDDSYQVAGMWQLSVEEVQALAAHRQYDGISKYQISQSVFKKNARQLL